MTLPEMLAKICAAQEAARKAGADDAQVQALRLEIINENRKQTTGADYANQWGGCRQLPPEPEEPEPPKPKQRTMEYTPRPARKGDRF